MDNECDLRTDELKVASPPPQQNVSTGSASVGQPMSRMEHYRSKSIPLPVSCPRVPDANGWKYKTISPANPLSQSYQGHRQLQRLASHQGSYGTPNKERLEVSPFSRSRSKVFYASEDVWNNTSPSPVASGSIPGKKEEEESSKVVPADSLFNRSMHHRSSSGRKSYDSGFSDSGEPATSSSKSKQGSVERSPPRKVQKWSTTSPIKAFLKSHDLSSVQGLPKLSMLKCCIGMGPGFPFNSRTKKIQAPEVPKTPIRDSCLVSFDTDANTKGLKGPSTPDLAKKPELSSKNEGLGTWPRIRKTKSSTLTEGPSSVPSKGSYHSTRLKGHPRLQERDNTGSLDRRKGNVARNLDERIAASIQNSSLQMWSKDLQWSTEDECMNTLQSKTVARNVADIIAMTNRNAKDTILTVHLKCEAIADDFAKLKRKIEKAKFGHTKTICDRISFNLDNLLTSCEKHQSKEMSIQPYLRLVTANFGILMHLLNRAQNGELNQESLRSLHETLYALKSAVSRLTEALILIHIKTIVDVLEEAPSLYSLKVAINTIEELAIHDIHLCQNISAAGGIHALLTICIDPRYKAARVIALRSLAMLCCVGESIREMEECGGIECITEILSERTSSEEEKREAAGFIAQITSPTLDSNHVVDLSESIPSLITSLTDLAKFTKSSDSFLLATAAIGNLTFLSNQACLHLHQCKTVWALVPICRKADNRSSSVFVKDQIATILANMSSLPEGRADVIGSGGLVVLLCFLQIRPCMAHSKAAVSACERVQQKSAIALSRLCNDVEVAKQVITLQGVQRLVRLCKDERERNQSDAVLVACLAVLRRIATACGFEEFQDLDAMELVEPRLLDTFLIYSSRQESYV